MQTAFLQNVHLFSRASTISLQRLSYVLKQHSYKKGAVILDHYQSQQTFLYVIQGWVKLFKESSEGEEIILDVLTRNHYCGETFLFKFQEQDAYTAKSISDLEVFTLPMGLLKQVIISDHNLSLNFLKETLQKQNELNISLEHLSIQNAMQRIGCFLLRLRTERDVQKNIRLILPYDKTLLASRLGMRPETFSRALAKLTKQYGIQVNNEFVEIPQPFKLIHYVCQHCSQIFPCNLIE
ncbi:MAG: hypothetical protein K0R24_733 [Gammaproteobacteria bacterium]|jgi:CRP-like cAMP-binding protein|nr:hypothetical protein [Gammaproteobacteria bacterium]